MYTHAVARYGISVRKISRKFFGDFDFRFFFVRLMAGATGEYDLSRHMQFRSISNFMP